MFLQVRSVAKALLRIQPAPCNCLSIFRFLSPLAQQRGGVAARGIDYDRGSNPRRA
ncbi:hypothetical protein BSIN_0658 [Burkholderia singularis]|uniref:Uncharacterized protein n=1 Tax=Burkholderia singularis TaxID=1503053 RepID=A0A238H8U6_9BURK|nr:hypothetical protein BSIN_0658 [Burkholderia singularis]